MKIMALILIIFIAHIVKILTLNITMQLHTFGNITETPRQQTIAINPI